MPSTLAPKLLRLAKIAAVLSVELSVTPVACAAALLTPKGPRAEKLLLLQNRLRRQSLRWIFPEYRS